VPVTEVLPNTHHTMRLAEFASELTFSDIPRAAVDHAKRCIRDALACGLFGSTLDWTKRLTATMEDVGGPGSATLWGTGKRLSADAAALINGTAVHSFELDDLHKTAIMHPGGVTLPPLLALAENGVDASGQDVITALVAGYEIGIRVGLAVGVGLLHRGWHNNGVLGTFSSAAGSGRLLGLTAKQMHDAIGTAASQAGGLMAAQYGSMVKRFHAGRAAQSGLYSAALASNGFTGISDVFEDRYGMFLPTFADSYRAELLTSGLGTTWEIENVGFKCYPACGSSHTSIDAAIALRDRHKIDPERIRSCVISTSTATKDHVGWPYVPSTITTAQMNLSFAVAAAFLRGNVTVADFAPEEISNPALVDLASRVLIEADRRTDERGPRFRHAISMRVELDDGKVLKAQRDHAKGSEYFPLSDAELEEKFQQLASAALPADGVAELEQVIQRLDDVGNVGELTAILRR
jgi:aconitate decarboxylase